jgi:Fe/S biogenesis protein NfuA
MSKAQEPPPRSSIVTITPAAHQRLVALRDQQADPERQGLRLRVAAIEDDHFHHDLRFDSVTKAALTDEVRTHDGLKVIIAAVDVMFVHGSLVDYTETEGLVVRNPNTPPLRGTVVTAQFDGDLIDDDDVACAVREAIALQVNPMLAAHGGYVQFIGHDGLGTAHLTMGGGCQGCSLSAMTMRDGVRAMLSDTVPAIQRVADITDHAAGAHPYHP